MPTDPREIALANAVKRFRKIANLHDSSHDSAIVRFAFEGGAEFTGSEGVRAAALALDPDRPREGVGDAIQALETARRATIDRREASRQGTGAEDGGVNEVRSELLS